MSDFDIKLVRFLLESNEQELKKWYKNATEDDLLYASCLMEIYGHALEDQCLSDRIDRIISQMPVLTEAQAVIAAVRG